MATATLDLRADTPPIDLEEAPAGDILYEVIDGKVVEKPEMGALAGVLRAGLMGRLVRTDGLFKAGTVYAEMLFHLDRSRPRKRRPDLSFVSYERWPKKMPVPDVEAWLMVPDLAVEFISPSETAVDVVQKIREYFQAGVRLVWVIYPAQRLIYVYQSEVDVRVLRPGEFLEGGDVLPGFSLRPEELFGEAPAPAEPTAPA
ncbi:MAG: Uma2 family endonuclease [Isosphaeraceae bacterium]